MALAFAYAALVFTNVGFALFQQRLGYRFFALVSWAAALVATVSLIAELAL